jgi:nitroreductase
MRVLEAIRKRRTVRVPFDPDPVAPETWGTFWEISQRSPFGDPPCWRLAPIEDSETKFKLAKIVKEEFGDRFQKNSEGFREVFSQYPKWLRFAEAKDGIVLNRYPRFAKHLFGLVLGHALGPLFGKIGIMNPELKSYCSNLVSAPLVVGVFLDTRVRFGPSGIPSIWNVGAMLQNMRLASTALGLCYQDLGWITATDGGVESARKLLGLPDYYLAVNFFRVGYARNPGAATKKSDFRRDLKDIVHLGRFGNGGLAPSPSDEADLDVLAAIRADKRASRPARPVAIEEVAYVLEAARWAPTGFNVQPFEFVYFGQDASNGTIVLLEDKERGDPDPGPCEDLAAGGVLQNIRLAAQAAGLEIEIRKASAAEEESLKQSLQVPSKYAILCTVTLREEQAIGPHPA